MFGSLQEKTIIGSLLGDGGLIATGGGRRYRFTVSHCTAQKDYLFWEYDILKDIVRTPPRHQQLTNSWKFNTVSSDLLTELHGLFYKGRQKVVPDLVREAIKDPYVLAVWYMDDGNLRRQNGKVYGSMLNSQSFSYEDNQKLSQWLKEHYGLNSTLQRNHGKYRLYFGADSWKNFCHTVAPFVIDTMRYKLP